MSELRRNTGRVAWIDCAKGITILLVIVGHTIHGSLQGMIFSFHMPLFFILSCVTTRFSGNAEELLLRTRRSFRHLILPAFLMFLLPSLFYIGSNLQRFTDFTYFRRFIIEKILVLSYSSGVKVSVLSEKIPALGIPWFLVVLFIGRTMLDAMQLYLPRKRLWLWCGLLSVTGFIFGKVQWLPLSFDIALAILPLLCVGKEFSRLPIEEKPWQMLFISGAAWGILLLVFYFTGTGYLELAARRYPIYPLSLICATAGTIMVSAFCVLFTRVRWLSKPLIYLGKNSIWMLGIHVMDFSFQKWQWRLTASDWLNLLLRLSTDLIAFVLCMGLVTGIKKILTRSKRSA